jgi:hypothetical protein
VESVFSAIKRKFGDNIRSRSDAAKVNEALCKIVCHNLCRVILSQCELGIEAEFWKDDQEADEDEGPAILSMVRQGVKGGRAFGRWACPDCTTGQDR